MAPKMVASILNIDRDPIQPKIQRTPYLVPMLSLILTKSERDKSSGTRLYIYF